MTEDGTPATDRNLSSPGRAWVFGDDIDTDQIIPSRFLVTNEAEKLGQHAFNDLRPAFSEQVEAGDFVVGGHNFGSGSSREHAPISLVGTGIDAVVAQSFARIFFRNGLNLGLPVLICPDADRIDDGDEISLDIEAGTVYNHTTDESYDAEQLPPFLQNLVDSGGLKPYTKAKLEGE